MGMHRNTVTGPPLKDWDFAPVKNFAIGHIERDLQQLQCRREFLNFTNAPPFGLPDTGIQDTTVGQVLNAGAPREVQLSLKYLFYICSSKPGARLRAQAIRR